MADTIEELKKKLADAEAEAKNAKAEAAALREKTGPRDNTGVQVKGTFAVELETPGGKKEKKKLKFQPGYVNCRLENGQVVISETLMKLANGGKLTEEERAKSPALANMDATEAADWLTHLARIRASFLIPA